jgi:hypothetical protein
MRVIVLAGFCGATACGPASHEQPSLEPVEEWVHADVRAIDLLLVTDNSSDMVEELSSLLVELPRMLRALTSGDLDGDGVLDFRPPESIHAGVVTSDMGTGGHRIPTCSEPGFGDDGRLVTAGDERRPGCEGAYPPIRAWRAGDDPTAFIQGIACTAGRSPMGCGFEQPLDALLKAVTPSTSSIRFVDGTSGHGDGANSGFLRDDSLLVVLLLTKEEDCSAFDPTIFDPMSSLYTGDLNLRCFVYPGALHPVSRYADGLLALRTGREDQLVFAAWAGIPVRVSTIGGDNFDEILADPEMQWRISYDSPFGLVPSCNIPGRGAAYPPRRIVEVAREIDQRGGRGLAQSICQTDYAPAANQLISHLASRLTGPEHCLREPLPVSTDDRAACWIEIDGSRIDQLATRDGVPEPGEGWYVERGSPSCPRGGDRIGLTEGVLGGRSEIALFCPGSP